MLVRPHGLEHREIIRGADIPQYNARVTLRHPQLRTLNR